MDSTRLSGVNGDQIATVCFVVSNRLRWKIALSVSGGGLRRGGMPRSWPRPMVDAALADVRRASAGWPTT